MFQELNLRRYLQAIKKMNNLQIELKRQKEKEPNKTTNEIFIELYLRFKDKCFNSRIEDIDEIIKLFEVWTRTCSQNDKMKEYYKFVMFGIMTGLLVGGLLDLITGFTWMWIIFVIFGIQQGIIMAERNRYKKLNLINERN